jgi:anti-anti-sigma factor
VPPLPSIEIEIHTRASCVVTLYGEHDRATSDGVTLALALARDYTHLLVDLTPCTFLDGSVINALLSTAKRMRAGGASLELAVGPRHVVRRTLELAGVLPLLPMHASRAVGIAAIATAETLANHTRPQKLRALSMEIDDLGATTQDRKHPAAKMRGVTVLRARVADATSDALESDERRAA